MILVNGTATDSVAVSDRGLAYGDGVFRTLLTGRGIPRWWPWHYRKLERDCASLAIPCPPEALLTEEIGRAVDRHSDEVVKIIVTRGGGERGYAPPQAPSPTRIVMTAAAPRHAEACSRSGVKVQWCRTRSTDQPRLAGVKHLNRLENVLARAEWNDPATAEGLMVDREGNLVGGTMTNIFIVEDGRLVTPSQSNCGVAGVARERVIMAAHRNGVECREESITRSRFLEAQEALLVNSVIGLWPIKECSGHTWLPGAFAGRVRQWLDEEGY